MTRLATLLGLLMFSSACGSDPISAPTPAISTSFSVKVVDETDKCINGAIVEVVGGQRLGQQVIPTENDCGEPGPSASLTGLTPGVAMTLRASAPDYDTTELTVVPAFPMLSPVLFRLNRLPAPAPPLPPPPSSSQTTFLQIYVVGGGGACLEDAVVEVLAGQNAGQSIRQLTPCDAWDYGNGVLFRNLIPDIAMTLRASAPGYRPEEKIVVPVWGYQTALVFALSRSE